MASTRSNKTRDPDELVKVSLNLPMSVLEKVERLARNQSFNRTTIIRRAIDIEAYFDEVRRRGGKVLIKEGDDIKEVVFR
jgi:predicted transcriptional regulator